jgi:hypothetical protein
MRALVVAVLLALAAPAGTAFAQTAASPAPHGRLESPTIDPSRVPEMQDQPDPERGTRRPSGYWTGYRPAKGGAYKWPLMLVGLCVTAICATILVTYLRRVSRKRVTSSAGWSGRRS